MPHYRYLIVGAGMTGDSAARGIREADAASPIGLIGAEPNPPYDRPPLSKGLWKDQQLDKIWRDTTTLGVDLHLGRRVMQVDKTGKLVVDDRGTVYTFDRLLLATGGTPRHLPFDTTGNRIIYYRSVDDYRRLRALAGTGQRFAVIGGGFIGSEIAAALALNGKQVVMMFPEASIGARVFPAALGSALNAYYREKGVEVRAGELVSGLRMRGDQTILTTQGGGEIDADGVVAGVGIQPNAELASAAGLPTEDGIVVDEFLRAGHPDVYAAGDVARFFNPALGTRLRVEHEDNANTMGHAAGRNMAGQAAPYHHLPFFYSDLFDLGYEAVGDVDARLTTVEDWKDPFREGVVYYLKDGRVRGVLLWNVWGQVDNARALIAQPGPFTAQGLRGRLPA
jgi:NADPH-dependent 2,4-dienoyl-CoA reductase/sulfur reductase-like enzyme